MKRTRLRRERGYTVVEVMSAMTLFAIGAAGVISMQRVTIQGGDDARRMDIAVNIAHEWSARLHRDAAFWTRPSASFPDENNLAQTTWLSGAAGLDATTLGPWTTPPLAGDHVGRSPAFDLFGRDLPAAGGDPHIFCTQYRFRWITHPGATGASQRMTALLRAEIRVYYARLDEAPIVDCFGYDPEANKPRLHFVHVTTAVRPNPEP
ncbi:MAG: prepilin-type N-terminal cleavage/methylation domain-containing protein [Labilithrix sp.]|nr:prepilin-type N-terminal cleavage/methylation domain-containing protein [Labilithrix sp.]MCW5815886.1 prepilin-type N-terminal cleavage/methylation domain-containing protein [Labilithrix sp.]